MYKLLAMLPTVGLLAGCAIPKAEENPDNLSAAQIAAIAAMPELGDGKPTSGWIEQ
jgi:hypothetical protein